jgi:tRNA 2-thiouridine synthesizing protein A
LTRSAIIAVRMSVTWLCHGESDLEEKSLSYSDRWDAGEMGCGELILKLKVRMSKLNAGETLWLTALDTGAIEDIPAWCRMTKHQLTSQSHPDYWIEARREN